MSQTHSFSDEEIRLQVDRITQSEGFRESERLQEFLKYIVEEALAGRAAKIKGLTVAQTVFTVGENFDPESNSIVRVEAGRLRRRLDQYYAGGGASDPILIAVPKGSYAPAFSPNPGAQKSADSSSAVAGSAAVNRKPWYVGGVLLLIVFAAFVWPGIEFRPPEVNEPTGQASLPIPQAEEQILFQQAFVILMPPENRARLDTAMELFQSLSEQHPEFPGGYAGQSLANSIGVLFIKSRDRAAELDRAIQLAEQTIAIDSDYSMGFAALAFAQSLSEQHEQALANARRSIVIRNREPITEAMVSLTLLNSDKPQAAIEVLNEALRQNLDQPRTPYRNLLGIAEYVVGDYDKAEANFELNRSRNGPSGPHMDVFIVATYGRLGKEFQARAVIEQLDQAYPDYPVEAWMANYIKQADELRSTMALLHSLGLQER